MPRVGEFLPGPVLDQLVEYLVVLGLADVHLFEGVTERLERPMAPLRTPVGQESPGGIGVAPDRLQRQERFKLHRRWSSYHPPAEPPDSSKARFSCRGRRPRSGG